MLEKLIRYFKGYTGIRTDGGFKDSFFEECKNRNTDFYKIREKDNSLYFFTSPKNTELIREIAERSGMDFTVTGTYGFKNFLRKNQYRIVFAAGLLITALFTVMMYMRVWCIEIKGNEKLFTNEIISLCEELGLHTGVKKSNIDTREFQDSLIERSDGNISYASLNISGMYAELIIREAKKAPPDLKVKEGPSNIVADFDGEIKTVRVYSGVGVCKRGDGVHKGDLLISGVRENENGIADFLNSRGVITARHTLKIKSEKKNRDYTVCESTKKAYGISLFGIYIPLGMTREKEGEQITQEESFLVINKVRLPFSVKKYIRSVYGEKASLDEGTEKLLEMRDYLENVRVKTLNSNVLSEQSKYKGGYSGSADCLDYIGVRQEIRVE